MSQSQNTDSSENRKELSKKLGLVLSGGGIRGMAHIGVIKALEEKGIHPDSISGASSGALVGAFYAAGYPVEKILSFFRETTFFSIEKYAFGKPAVIDTDKFFPDFKAYFPEDSFEALQKKLVVSTTDILTGKNVLFHKGPLINRILASAAFPGVLSPVVLDGTLYADGGISNNFPVEPLRENCKQIIGVYANPIIEIKAEDLSSTLSMMERAFKIAMGTMSIRKFEWCDILICPKQLNQFGTFSLNHLDEAYTIGYEEATKSLANFEVFSD